MPRRNPVLACIVAALLSAALAGCSGSHSGAAAAATSSRPASDSTAASLTITKDPNSPTCRYAKSFASSMLQLALSVPPNSLDLASDGSAPELKRYIDAEAQGTGIIVSTLKKLTPPTGFKGLHADLLGIYGGLDQQLGDAQRAFAAGDHQRANDLLNAANASLTSGAGAGDLDQRYPQQAAQLNACLND